MEENDNIVRLVKCTLCHVKNVGHGTLELIGRERNPIPAKYRTPDMRGQRGRYREAARHASLVGVYGQNGTGKTALVDALEYVRDLLCGNALPEDFLQYIMFGEKSAEVACRFYWRHGHMEGLVDYRAETGPRDGRLAVLAEALDFTPFSENTGRKGTPVSILRFGSEEKDGALFLPEDAYSRAESAAAGGRDALLKILAVAESNRQSRIFSDAALGILLPGLAPVHATLVNDLKKFARNRVQIVNRRHGGLVTLGVMPFATGAGVLPMPVNGPVSIPAEWLQQVERVVSRLNPVMSLIIPDLSMRMKHLGSETSDSGALNERVELMVVRNGHELPARLESEGIRKIISLLGAFGTMYNTASYLLVVDELDSGIYEYLLGKMLQTFEQSAKGQLVFTSHNLRPLETLHADSIVFTTTNPQNRFIRFKGQKPTHNLRDCYIRSLHAGGQEERLYENNDLDEVGIAFCLAGEDEL